MSPYPFFSFHLIYTLNSSEKAMPQMEKIDIYDGNLGIKKRIDMKSQFDFRRASCNNKGHYKRRKMSEIMFSDQYRAAALMKILK